MPNKHRASAIQLEKAGADTLRVSGELSFDTVSENSPGIEPLLDDGVNPVIDLAAVTRVDSAGVALLIEWQRQARHRQRQLRFINTPAQILAIARVSGVDTLLSLATADRPA